MDYIKLAQRTIAMLSSMIESGECHTTRSKEMKDNALNGLEQLRLHDVVWRSEQLKAFADYAQKRVWEDGDKDLSEFVDEFLRL